jgi:hypothetical protein
VLQCLYALDIKFCKVWTGGLLGWYIAATIGDNIAFLIVFLPKIPPFFQCGARGQVDKFLLSYAAGKLF